MFDQNSSSMALLKKYRQTKEYFDTQKAENDKLEVQLNEYQKKLSESASFDDDMLNSYTRAKERMVESRKKLQAAKETFENAETPFKEILSDFKNKPIAFRLDYYSHLLVTYFDDGSIEIK